MENPIIGDRRRQALGEIFDQNLSLKSHLIRLVLWPGRFAGVVVRCPACWVAQAGGSMSVQADRLAREIAAWIPSEN
ncbi:DUF6417 family protein [Streptomyces adustus]|uniref:DUF6417 family protein n=1 Tax=Streptomyces adustus TaxID=1609272 RepID=UPI00371C6BD8